MNKITLEILKIIVAFIIIGGFFYLISNSTVDCVYDCLINVKNCTIEGTECQTPPCITDIATSHSCDLTEIEYCKEECKR